jgi:hypothetical protein
LNLAGAGLGLLDPAVQNYEFPLSCRTEPGVDQVRYQVFPDGPHETLRLSDQERQRKEEVVRWAGTISDVVSALAPLYPRLDEESYRAVPWDRDYASPPPGLERHYDDYGRALTQRGVLESPILFDDHFVPIARALGLTSVHPARAVDRHQEPRRRRA